VVVGAAHNKVTFAKQAESAARAKRIAAQPFLRGRPQVRLHPRLVLVLVCRVCVVSDTATSHNAYRSHQRATMKRKKRKKRRSSTALRRRKKRKRRLLRHRRRPRQSR
jgi:hypothetical protein